MLAVLVLLVLLVEPQKLRNTFDILLLVSSTTTLVLLAVPSSCSALELYIGRRPLKTGEAEAGEAEARPDEEDEDAVVAALIFFFESVLD